MQDLLIGGFAKRVDTTGDDDDCLTARDILHSIQDSEQSVVKVSFREARSREAIEGTIEDIVTLAEVHERFDISVIFENSDFVVMLEDIEQLATGRSNGLSEDLRQFMVSSAKLHQ